MYTLREVFDKWKDASVKRLAVDHYEINELDLEILLTEKFAKFCEQTDLDQDGFEVREFFESGLDKVINEAAQELQLAFSEETAEFARDFLNRNRLAMLNKLKFKESQEKPIVSLVDTRRNPGENTRL